MAIFVKHHSLILFSFTVALSLGWFQALPAQAGSSLDRSATPNRFRYGKNIWAEDADTGRVNKDLCIPPRSQVQPQALPQRQVAGDRNFLQSSRATLVPQSVQVVQRVSTVQAAPSPQYVPSPPVQPLSAQPGAVQPRIVCGDGEVYIFPPVTAVNPGTPLAAPVNRGVRPGAATSVSARRVTHRSVAKDPTVMTYAGKGYSPGSSAPGAYASGTQGYAQAEVSARVRSFER